MTVSPTARRAVVVTARHVPALRKREKPATALRRPGQCLVTGSGLDRRTATTL